MKATTSRQHDVPRVGCSCVRGAFVAPPKESLAQTLKKLTNG